MKDINSTYQNLLDSLRNNPNEIQNFNFVIENETDRPIDKNELQRFRLSIAIYNDFRNEDEGIIDFLIKEQIIAMKKAIDPTNTFGARNGVFSTNMDDTNEKNKHNKSSS